MGYKRVMMNCSSTLLTLAKGRAHQPRSAFTARTSLRNTSVALPASHGLACRSGMRVAWCSDAMRAVCRCAHACLCARVLVWVGEWVAVWVLVGGCVHVWCVRVQ